MEQSFIAYIENSIKNNWDLDALTDYKGATLQYKDVARKIEKLHIIFEESGIRKGDKIAVCGRNSSHWGVTFLATLTYGAVIVPILHEFKADNVHNIVNHSEAKLLLVGDMVWENLNESAMPLLEGILMMNDFTLLVSRSERLTYAREHLNEMFGKKFPKNFRKEHVAYHKDEPEELAAAIEMIDLYEPLLQDCTAAGYAWRAASGGADCTRRKPLPEGGCLHMKLDWLLPRGFTVHCSSVISTLTADCGFAAPDSALARYAQPELSDHNVVRASLALPQKEE